MSSNLLFVGTKAQVAAIDKNSGETRWLTKLKGGLAGGSNFVNLLVQDGRVYAHTYGELYCLDQETGAILWKNELSGLGYDIASLAIEGIPSSVIPALAAFRNRQASATTPYVAQ
jgi:outer membrane protein assembly factor BamB